MEWDKHMGAFSYYLESGDSLVCQLKCLLNHLHKKSVSFGLTGCLLCIRLRDALSVTSIITREEVNNKQLCCVFFFFFLKTLNLNLSYECT